MVSHVFREIFLNWIRALEWWDALEVLIFLFIAFRNFLYSAQSRGSFNAIAFVLTRRKMIFVPDRDTEKEGKVVETSIFLLSWNFLESGSS